ncbi:nicotinamide-nucleotide adenylyltransferase [Floricoccus penangensis]|uniref:Nicotinamide-nucleotide adenylyltransferase n=1 Tax=Floricoccus penangensis TaxID=1859475 RepID=A0A9Q5JHF9_9LACT|nr:nicotinamide-nucleotide adenylyltransferase [Floricoccus penangensis]OFI47062.1 nicotinamide-nucleotide adenylyltransferase [Floricoccus penangensis]
MTTNNISKGKLKGQKIGIYFGTFAPLHIGHQQQIYKTAALNEGVLLVASGYDGDRGDKIGLNLEKRYRYLRQAFNDEADIKVAKLDENGMPPMPDGWDVWTERLLSLIYENTIQKNLHVTFYVGEEEYVTELSKRFPIDDGNTYSVERADRHDILISSTMIRENPQAHWNDINRVFRRHFSKVVTLMGGASTGKSTLVRRLARSISAPFSEEYARYYEEVSNIDDDELRLDDYARLILGQYDANSNEICSPSNNGIVFLDTDAIVTRVYAKLYLSKEEQEDLEPLFQRTIRQEKMDLILVIPPITKYVNDGFRNMVWEESRYEFHEELMRQLDEFGLMNKVVVLDDKGDGGRDEYGYLARYHHAIDAVKEYTGVEIQRLEY